MKILKAIIVFFRKILDFIFSFFNKESKKYPYVKKDFLLSKYELKFYNFLRKTLPPEYEIFCKVRVIDVIEPKYKKWHYWKNKIIQKHVDFVICKKPYMNIKLAIELNDSSHKFLERNVRDNFLNLAFNSAWLPILFFSPSELKNPDYVFKLIISYLR